MEEKTNAKKVDTYSYKGWLNSDHFAKRAFAVLGYYIAGILMLYALIFGIILAFGLLAAGLGAIFN